jgi:integrase
MGVVWLASQTHLKPSSFRPLEIAWRIYVEPRWGNIPVGRVQHSEVQTWVSSIGKSATTALRAYGVLAAILDVAVRDRRIASNPARGVSLPRKGKKARAYLSHEQVELLARESKRMAPLVYTLAYCGLRWGEATALRVKSVDRVRRRLTVTENAVMVGGTLHVGTPKTHESRSVPYPAFLDALLPIEGKSREQLVFGAGDSHLRSPDGRRGWFVGAVARCREIDPEFPVITIHDLRHTAASLGVSAGANVKAVQRMLGHASAAMTLDTYADLFDDDLDAVAVALDQAKRSANVVKMWSSDDPGNDETP